MKIWHALKDTETGIAFSNSEDDDYPSREKKDTGQSLKKIYPFVTLISEFDLSKLGKHNHF